MEALFVDRVISLLLLQIRDMLTVYIGDDPLCIIEG